MDTYTINPAVVHDIIEGEVILLNLETGTYYQLKNEAVRVWSELERGASPRLAAANLASSYHRSPHEILQAINPFIAELVAESILIPASAPVPDTALAAHSPGDETSEFHPPVLLKYTDMQSLLLLDPIHDVDTPGWPQQRADVPG
jgi:hypothetical protein